VKCLHLEEATLRLHCYCCCCCRQC